MQFNEKTFCPYIIDKSTPIKKYLHCTKRNDLCKMVTYFPNGQMIPKQDVKNLGCPYGYVIQGIEKENNVTLENNGLDDISKVEKQKDNPEPKTNTQKPKQNKQSTTSKKRKTKKKS